MRLRLEFPDDMAVLVVEDGDHRTEVRGHRGVGAKWVGDKLDRTVAALPKTVNVSSLFADETVHVRRDDAAVIRAHLEWEEEMVRRLFSATWAN